MQYGQLRSHTDTGYRKNRRWVKRQTSRLARRLGKILREDAPKKVTRGYDD